MLDPGGGGAPKRGGKARRTPTEIGQTTPSTPTQQAQKSRALRRSSSGSRPSTVYTNTSATTTPTLSAGSAVSGRSSRQAARQQARLRAARERRREQKRIASSIQRNTERTIERIQNRLSEDREIKPGQQEFLERRTNRASDKLWQTSKKASGLTGRKPEVNVKLAGKPVKVTQQANAVTISPQKALKVAKPGPRKRQRAQKVLKPVQQQVSRVREGKEPDPAIEGRKEKRVAKKLKKAAKKTQGGLARKLDRGFGPNETITPRQAAIVMESEGLPGITYAEAIIPGESGYRPGVPNPDDGYPSLIQATPSVQSAETRAKWDKIASKRPGGPTNPIVAAKQAKVLAKGTGDEGVSNYYGFDASAPQGHLPGGQKRARQILYGDPKPIPSKLKRKAKTVLGEKATKKVIAKAKKPPVAATPTKKPGVNAGSRSIVKELVGKDLFGTEGRGDKEDRGYSSLHDISTHPNAYAADLPVSEGTVDRIAKKLGLDPDQVDYGTRGLESGVTYKGYEIEFLPYTHGSGPHIHIGAEWTGGTLPSGTVSGSGAVASDPSVTGSASYATGQAVSGGGSQKRSKGRKLSPKEIRKIMRRFRSMKPSERLTAFEDMGYDSGELTDEYGEQPTLSEYARYIRSVPLGVDLR